MARRAPALALVLTLGGCSSFLATPESTPDHQSAAAPRSDPQSEPRSIEADFDKAGAASPEAKTMAPRKLAESGRERFVGQARPKRAYAPQSSVSATLLPAADTEAPEDLNREGYEPRMSSDFKSPKDAPLSTFSIDVDTAGYANLRRILNESRMPPKDAVKIEELINYFDYDYPAPHGDAAEPFAVHTEVARAPWNPAHGLVRIGIQGKKLSTEELPASNLVFLLDVSGSMNAPNKLPLLKQAFKLLVQNLRPSDRVAIVVYAGAAGLVLPSTAGSERQTILGALDRLQAGGSTAGGAGIQLAYEIAQKSFIRGGNNRVILATDGDFNVGPSSDGELVRMIEKKRERGVFLTVLGFGTGNYQDAKMEKLADKGNGNHAYIDSIMEAKKVLVSEMGGTLFTIAKDVKIQVELNPAFVKAYRLIGYDNRRLAARDFNDDKKDAGELGAGHTVTALYEIIYADAQQEVIRADELKYQRRTVTNEVSDEIMNVKLRYKAPDENTSKLITRPVKAGFGRWSSASPDFRWAASVAAFGLLLRDSENKGEATYSAVREWSQAAKGADLRGYREQHLRLIDLARRIAAHP